MSSVGGNHARSLHAIPVGLLVDINQQRVKIDLSSRRQRNPRGLAVKVSDLEVRLAIG